MKRFSVQELALFRILQQRGVPLQPDQSYKLPAVGFTIGQIPNLAVNTVMESESGGMHIVADLTITNDLEQINWIRSVQLTAPWGNIAFSLLPEPTPPLECYSFANSGLAFPEQVVLNRFLSGKSRFDPCFQASGLLLATSDDSLPDAYRNSRRLHLELGIVDDFRNRFAVELKVVVEAIEKRAPFFKRAGFNVPVESLFDDAVIRCNSKR